MDKFKLQLVTSYCCFYYSTSALHSLQSFKSLLIIFLIGCELCKANVERKLAQIVKKYDI